MPGPGANIPGYKAGVEPPPKAVTKPWVVIPELPDAATAVLPPDVLSAWRGFWHAIGSNLPWYINHSRANRRAMNHFLRTHG